MFKKLRIIVEENAPEKIGRDAFLYLDGHSGKFAQCGTCIFGRENCAIMNGTKVSAKEGSCGFYIKGSAKFDAPVAKLTKDETGYVERQVRCENCYWGDDGTCGLYKMLNEKFPKNFDLDDKISSDSCCNANTKKTK